jgi:aspartate 1-decarboxylase
MSTPADLTLPSKRIDPDLAEVLRSLTPGDRIEIIQTVRVGQRLWTTTVQGKFRDVNYLVTGLATERVRADDIVVPTVHFTKDNGELSSITLDEHSQVRKL